MRVKVILEFAPRDVTGNPLAKLIGEVEQVVESETMFMFTATLTKVLEQTIEGWVMQTLCSYLPNVRSIKIEKVLDEPTHDVGDQIRDQAPRGIPPRVALEGSPTSGISELDRLR